MSCDGDCKCKDEPVEPMPLPDPSPIFSRTTPIYGMNATSIHAQAAQAPYRGIERALGDLAVAEEHKVAAIREVAVAVRVLGLLSFIAAMMFLLAFTG